MSTRNDTQAALIKGFAVGKDLELYEIAGQWLYPIYAAGGSLSCNYIVYFVKPDSGVGVPRDGEELGREGKCHEAMIAVEFQYFWDDSETLKHLKDVVGQAMFELEREKTIHHA